MQKRLNLLVLGVKQAHVNDQIANDRQPGKWPDNQLAVFNGFRERRNTSQAIFAIDVETIGAAHPFTTAAAVGHAGVGFSLYGLQHVQNHQVPAFGVEVKVLHIRGTVHLGVVSVDADLQHG